MLKYVGRFRMLMKARAEWVMLHGFRQQCWLLLMLQSQRALQRDIHDGYDVPRFAASREEAHEGAEKEELAGGGSFARLQRTGAISSSKRA
jgi:hypothetical protein